jgi:tetratricopeptide (TPR) repeat protein
MKEQYGIQVSQFLKEGNFTEAYNYARNLVENNPSDHVGFELMGDVFAEMSNWHKAIECYRSSEHLQPTNPAIYFKIGSIFEKEKNSNEALRNFQIAFKIFPQNKLLGAYAGKNMYVIGMANHDTKMIEQGLILMNQALEANQINEEIRGELSNAYLDLYNSGWVQYPTEPGVMLATSKEHVQGSKQYIDYASYINQGSDSKINYRIQEAYNFINQLLVRKFTGYNYIWYVPAGFTALFLFSGIYILAIFCALLGIGYYISQLAPMYLINRRILKENSRDPFIVRRLNAVGNAFEGITIFGTLSQVFFWRFAIQGFVALTRYSIVMFLLPFEIIRGFINNYQK